MSNYRNIDCRRGSGAIQRGYYRKTRNNVTYPQHRLAYMDKYGPISSDLIIHHECHNKWCVTPEHLTPMTRSKHQVAHANDAAKVYYDNLTTCKLGHPLDGRNKVQRFCLTCKHAAQMKYLSQPGKREQMNKKSLEIHNRKRELAI